MPAVEALREVKRAEAEVKRLKDEASKESARILRDAERKAAELAETARKDADRAAAAALEQARAAVAKERDSTLKAGTADANKIRAKAKSPDFTKAVDLLVKNFEAKVGMSGGK